MLPDELLDLFHRQHGLAATHQLRELISNPERRRTVRSHPDIDWMTSRVLRHRAAPWSTDQELMVGVLDSGPGALLWGKTATCRWGFGRFRSLPPHVGVVRRSIGGERVAQIHLLSSLEPSDRTLLEGLPIARPEVALLWLAGMWTHRLDVDRAAQRTAVALDQAWRQGLVDGAFLHDLVARSGGHGRSGIVALRRVVECRPPGYKPAGSRLEERFEEIVPWTVRNQLERQVTVDTETVTRTTDFRLRTWPLVVEVNGEAFHTSLSDRAADNERYRRFVELGFSVVIFWEHDIWHESETVRDAMLHLASHPDPSPTIHRPTKAPWAW